MQIRLGGALVDDCAANTLTFDAMLTALIGTRAAGCSGIASSTSGNAGIPAAPGARSVRSTEALSVNPDATDVTVSVSVKVTLPPPTSEGSANAAFASAALSATRDALRRSLGTAALNTHGAKL